MGLIKGITIKLLSKIPGEKDPFGESIDEIEEIFVENVLVAPITSSDIVNNTELEGKKTVYIIAIPKGDKNIWENQEVEFMNRKWKVFSGAMEGIENNIPLSWNKKYMVEEIL